MQAPEDVLEPVAASGTACRLRKGTNPGIDEIRTAGDRISTAVLDDHGLGVALRRYVAEYISFHNIAVELMLNQ